MRKIITLIILGIMFVNTIFAQVENLDLESVEKQFETMGQELSPVVTSNATTGLIWSDAYIGNFPHVGFGVFTGATIVPVSGFNEVISSISPDVSLPDEVSSIGGIPLPVVGFDGRVGGFGLPFDVGIKYGVLEDFTFESVTFDYSLIGIDLRYALLEENLVLPSLSIGVGYSYLSTNMKVEGLLNQNFEILAPTIVSPGLYLEDPDVEYGWESSVVEAKAQLSKTFLAITPYLGVNAAYGTTKIGGGVKTKIIDENDEEVTQEEIDEAVEIANLIPGTDIPTVKATGFETLNDTTAWGVKITGGVSFNIFIVKIDVSANYDVLAEVAGAQVGLRVQL